MLIYENLATKQICCFIHIPKNAGKSVRRDIKMDPTNRVIKEYWGIRAEVNLDLAHLPYLYITTKTKAQKGPHNGKPASRIIMEYMTDVSGAPIHIDKLPEQIANMRFCAYIRNPYDRIISAYFYLNPGKSDAQIEQFHKFIINILDKYNFGTYSRNFIHYYPQYHFVCDAKGSLQTNIELTLMPKKRISYKYTKFFTPECVDIINRVYDRDFALFGFDKVSYNGFIPTKK